jgi:hypothetical protein
VRACHQVRLFRALAYMSAGSESQRPGGLGPKETAQEPNEVHSVVAKG